MKRVFAIALALALLCSMAACGSGSDSAAESVSAASEPETAESAASSAESAEFRTMGDVFAYESSNYGSGDNYYVYVFEKDGVIYRAMTEFPPEVSEAVAAIDIFDPEYEAKVREAAAPLEITKLENLTEMIPSQEELDKLVGKSGQELLDEGWTFWSWQLDTMEFGMYYGPFAYTVVMEGTLANPENFDESEAGALTVKSVTYDGIGDAANIEFPGP